MSISFSISDAGLLSAHNGEVRRIAFSPDGSFLVTCAGDGVRLFRAPYNAARAHILDTSAACSVTSSSLYIAAGMERDVVRVWEMRGNPFLIAVAGSGTEHSISDVAFSPRHPEMLVVATENILEFFMVFLGSLVYSRKMVVVDKITCLAYSPSGLLLVAGMQNGEFGIVAGNQVDYRRSGRNCPVSSIAFSPRGELMALGLADGTVTVWQVPDFVILNTQERHSGEVSGVAFPSEEILVSGGRDGVLMSGLAKKEGVFLSVIKQGPAISCIASVPGGNWLAVGRSDGCVQSWQTRGNGSQGIRGGGITQEVVAKDGGTVSGVQQMIFRC